MNLQPPDQEKWLDSMKEKMERLIEEKEESCKAKIVYKNKVPYKKLLAVGIIKFIFRLRHYRL